MLTPFAPLIVLAVVAVFFANRRHRSYHFCDRNALQKPGPGEDFTGLPETEPWLVGNSQFCPVCTGEYIPGTESCEDCGVDLVDEEDVPESLARTLSSESIVRVGRIRTMSQSHLVRSWFTTISIPCALQRCNPYDVFGTDIYVFESDALRAKRLLRHFLESDVQLS